MTNHVKPIPEGYHTATPYMIIKDAAHAIEFYRKAFGATVGEYMTDADGKVRHADIKIGDSHFMITDEHSQFPDYLSPQSRGGTAVHFYLYVEDAETVFNAAVAAGATVLQPLKDQFYGDRVGGVTDPYGHVWYVSTHIEDVSPEEIQKRMAEQSRQ